MKQGYESDEYISVYLKDGTERIGDTQYLRRKLDQGHCDISSVYPFSSVPFDGPFDNAVSLVSVSDPLKPFKAPVEGLTAVYKQHAVCSLKDYSFSSLPENHRRNIKKGLSKFEVVKIASPISHLMNFHKVYQNLIKRHNITHTTNYSLDQIRSLLEAPGAVLFGSVKDSKFISYALFYISGDDTYYHIGSGNNVSYELNANFGVMHTALLEFQSAGLDRVEIGAVPDSGNEGLRRFKFGFGDQTRHNFITKRILDPLVYAKLSEGTDNTGFFPLYRTSK